MNILKYNTNINTIKTYTFKFNRIDNLNKMKDWNETTALSKEEKKALSSFSSLLMSSFGCHDGQLKNQQMAYPVEEVKLKSQV